MAIGVLVAVLLLVAVAGGVARTQYTSTQRSVLANERARATLAGSIIDTYFRGEVAALRAIASAPAVADRDHAAMTAYFGRLEDDERPVVQRRAGLAGHGGNPAGEQLARRERQAPRPLRPLVLPEGHGDREAGRERERHEPSRRSARDRHGRARGRTTGVLAGALLGRPSGLSQSSLELGGAGVAVLDRDGRSLLSGTPDPQNTALVGSLRGRGVIADTDGLDGSPDHAIAYTPRRFPAGRSSSTSRAPSSSPTRAAGSCSSSRSSAPPARSCSS